MAEEVRQYLLDAVTETIRSGSPEPARQHIGVIAQVDLSLPDREPPPGQTLALFTLIRWVSRPTRDEAFRPDPDALLEWIGEHVGRRYRARARYLIGVLEPGGVQEAVSLYADALGPDFLPALVWIAAGLTAVYGDGDPSWLVDGAAAAS
jgi:hypothetical protein